MQKRITISRTTAVLLLAGMALGIVVSAGALLASPELHGIWDDFRCYNCHGDIHGAVKLEDVPFNAYVLLTGDVPEAQYITVNDIFPYRESEDAAISIPDLLSQYGVQEFAAVNLVSSDGGFVFLQREFITDNSLLMPYLESIRFADENQHVSTWLKGVSKIVVIGSEKPLIVDGIRYSIGELLLENTHVVVTERGRAMYRRPGTEKTYLGEYSHLVEGRLVEDLVQGSYNRLIVSNRDGETYDITAATAGGAVIAMVRGAPTLVFPDTTRRDWVSDVIEIRSE